MSKIEITDKSPSMTGIFEGISKGDVWYDNDSNPSVGVAYSYCVGGCGIMGKLDSDEKKNREFFEKVFLELKKKKMNEFEFSIEEDRLCKQVLKLFENKIISREMEYSYRLESKIENTLIETLEDINFCAVDEKILQMVYAGRIANSEMLTDRLENSWNSKEDFLHYSNAILAMKENEIVGIIFGSSRYNQYIVVDIEVMEEYRKQGIATKLVRMFVNLCVEQGMVVQWDHVESNIGSKRLALKSGFHLFKSRYYYWFDI